MCTWKLKFIVKIHVRYFSAVCKWGSEVFLHGLYCFTLMKLNQNKILISYLLFWEDS